MTVQIPLTELSKILTSNLIKIDANHTSAIAKGLSTDTRKLLSGEIFLALVGENFDGHNFAAQAAKQGAIALIVNQIVEIGQSIPQIIVKDTLLAYQQIASWWRSQFSIPIIGITGSVGKTSTKELIAAVLGTQGKVLKTAKNYNNEIGVPKTLLQLSPKHDYAVIEMAMRGKGEIALLTEMVRPDFGVITNVGTAHIGRLGSVEAIAEAKCELLANLPKDGTAIINADSPLLIETAQTVWQGKTITYGLENGELRGQIQENEILHTKNGNFPVPLPGIHNASNYLAALAIAEVLEIDLAPIKAGLSVNLPQGRATRHQLAEDIVLLDETYNAGLESMQAALKMLKETPGKRHIAVLGTMKELGDYATSFHYQIGETIKDLDINLLFVLADETATTEIINGATGIESQCFNSLDNLVANLQQIVQSGDRILFKASNSVGLNQGITRLIESMKIT